jgi:NADPH:quinone reductase-like Zn-dependent oxidoreductase
MKAYEIQEFGIDKLTAVERPDVEPAANEVQVRFRAASLNFRDVMVASGTYNPRMKLPAVPLSDGAGEIAAIGSGVTKWKVGDRVMPIFAQRWFDGDSSEEKRRSSLGAGAQWDGVLRESGNFHEESVLEIPEHLSFEEAATLPCAALTAWHALVVSGQLRPGQTVLTLGTGGVSVFAAQLASIAGARIISTSSSDEKLERMRALGSYQTINYRGVENWEKAVLDLTDGVGVDHTVEVGGAGTLPKSIKSTRIGGHIALVGALTGAATFDPVGAFMKALRLQGIFVGSRAMFSDMLRAVSVNKLRPVVDRAFDFDEARDAFRYMESGSHFGKIVIRIG